MDIHLLGAWGELIGGVAGLISALAVIGSLIFVGIQIRQYAKAVRSSTRFEIARSQSEQNMTLAQNPDIMTAAYAYLKGEEVTDRERMVATQALAAIYRAGENQYFAYRDGDFSPSVWEGYRQNLIWNVQQPNFREFWDDRGKLFSADFSDFLEELANQQVPNDSGPATSNQP